MAEKFEVANFPFDCQDLPLKIQATAPVEQVIFIESPDTKEVAVFQLANYRLQEWTIGQLLYENIFYSYTPQFCYSQIYLRFNLQRNWSGYFYRLIILMFIISGVGLLTFALHPIEFFGDRLNNLTTLLLATVAFEFVAKDDIPKVSYMTFLDKYFLSSLIYLGLVALTHTLTISLSLEEIDHQIFWAAFGVFFFLQFSFMIYAFILIRLERRKLFQKRSSLVASDSSQYARGDLKVLKSSYDSGRDMWYAQVFNNPDVVLETPR